MVFKPYVVKCDTQMSKRTYEHNKIHLVGRRPFSVRERRLGQTDERTPLIVFYRSDDDADLANDGLLTSDT